MSVCRGIKMGLSVEWCHCLLLMLLRLKATNGDCTITDKSAACTTNQTIPFPKNLNAHTEVITIRYEGEEGFRLTAAMINRYRFLRMLIIDGNVSSIENHAFASALHLQRLILSHTGLQSFPDSAFGDSSDLNDLLLPHNPAMIEVPTNIFHSLEKLIYLDLSYNQFQMCRGRENIGEDFRKLQNLVGLSLAGLGDPVECKNISDKFFEPLNHLQQLNLSESAFFHGAQTILRPLTNLVDLEIYNIAPFNECPRLAKDLFGNLSSSIKFIQARSWRTDRKLKPNCTITGETLSGLTNLKQISTLDFEYGDSIFGNTLLKGVIQQLTQLRQLHLGWCRITEIEDGALAGLQLTNLELTGNPLGNDQFWPNGYNRSMDTIDLLVLKQCTITAEDNFPFYANFIVQNFPSLLQLDLSKNIMYRLPTFLKNGMLYTSNLSLSLNLHSNVLHQIKDGEVTALCQTFPNLKKLDLSDNYMTLIETMCVSLQELHINGNNLYVNPEPNFKTIKSLRHLTYLDLSDNSLPSIPNDLFDNMPKLKTLKMISNLISSLDRRQFIHNSQLRTLDMTKNLLETFHVSVFANDTLIKALSLRTNKISMFDETFTQFVDSTSTLTYLRIENNSFDCSCGQLYFQKWANSSKKLQYGDKLICHSPGQLRNQKIVIYKQLFFDCYFKWVLVGLAGLVGIITTVLLMYRFRWYLAHLRFAALSVAERLVDIKQQDQCKYDAMVLFNSKSDEETNWVKRLLIELEGGEYSQPINLQEPDGRENLIYIRARDDITGDVNFDSCCKIMKQSRKIILVLSNSFLREDECISEATFAGSELFSTATLKPERILILVLEELQEPLTNPVSSLLVETHYIDLYETTRNDERKMRAIWQKLRRFVSHRAKPDRSVETHNGEYEPLV